jgi:hypothetical protein
VVPHHLRLLHQFRNRSSQLRTRPAPPRLHNHRTIAPNVLGLCEQRPRHGRNRQNPHHRTTHKNSQHARSLASFPQPVRLRYPSQSQCKHERSV